ncbi:PREDICTED: inactive hydroxysteroid dehydrogenase-like protein 1 isoform X1 [Papilio xuthus]|uniref:Inactive hydroxysteroid dehydrogenase-like protein 1 isoform X1 n=2 Tax=Papilio xuthus TaxID=66420 RepID=A0AAJ6ZXZ7_PAPXU|nr:PREDICTED: inactive hydroxysteroid dehydrogenase-like protein 1 isoform X1 [Papilio xuthus]
MVLLIILAIIGAIAVILFLIDSLWSLLELVTSHLMPFFLPTEVQSLTKKFGSWAAVTGSTDGVGREYARELARRGLNVVLISRNQDKLRNVAAEIEKESAVKTKIIVADFSKGAEVYRHIEEELKDVPLGILVNNVGCQYEYPARLCELPAAKAWELINVNVGAVTMMSRLALSGMAVRGRGALVNVCSGSELQPLPLMAVYAATKVYVRSLTLAIREEYASHGIYVQHLSPLFIATKMNAFSPRLERGGLLVPDASTYARHAVAALGRVHDTTGYWLHGIQYFFIKVAPEWMRIKIGMYMNQDFRKEHFESVRSKAH